MNRCLALAAGMLLFQPFSLTAVDGSIPPTMPISEIMTKIVTPASDALWAASAEFYEENPSLDEEQWQAATDASLSLAGAAEALETPGRPVASGIRPNEDTPQGLPPSEIADLVLNERDLWVSEAQGMGQAVREVQAAIGSRDLEAFANAGNVLYEACESCHKRFWYPER